MLYLTSIAILFAVSFGAVLRGSIDKIKIKPLVTDLDSEKSPQKTSTLDDKLPIDSSLIEEDDVYDDLPDFPDLEDEMEMSGDFQDDIIEEFDDDGKPVMEESKREPLMVETGVKKSDDSPDSSESDPEDGESEEEEDDMDMDEEMDEDMKMDMDVEKEEVEQKEHETRANRKLVKTQVNKEKEEGELDDALVKTQVNKEKEEGELDDALVKTQVNKDKEEGELHDAPSSEAMDGTISTNHDNSIKEAPSALTTAFRKEQEKEHLFNDEDKKEDRSNTIRIHRERAQLKEMGNLLATDTSSSNNGHDDNKLNVVASDPDPTTKAPCSGSRLDCPGGEKPDKRKITH